VPKLFFVAHLFSPSFSIFISCTPMHPSEGFRAGHGRGGAHRSGNKPLG
jgi:hypothetical protein